MYYYKKIMKQMFPNKEVEAIVYLFTHSSLCYTLGGSMKILIASDSYKGSLSSLEVSKSIQKGFKEVFEDVSFKTLSMADGGEGTTQAIVESLNGQYITIDCHNALQEPIQASYGITSQGAIIEMASASGLPLD